MVEKNDFMKVASPGMLSVTSRQDSSQNQYDQQKKNKKKNKKEDDSGDNEFEDFDDFEIDELIEFGGKVSKKRNKDLKTFMNTINSSSHFFDASLDPTALSIEDVDSQLVDDSSDSVELLTKLHVLYSSFFKIVLDESKIINMNEIDGFDILIRKKDIILDQIDKILKIINFNDFKKEISPAPPAPPALGFLTIPLFGNKNILPQNKEKTKADEILSEIHKVVNEIMKQENKNSVELQSLKEKMKLDIAKQERGAKAVSQYGQPNVKSHFIDKKT